MTEFFVFRITYFQVQDREKEEGERNFRVARGLNQGNIITRAYRNLLCAKAIANHFMSFHFILMSTS